MPLTRGTYGYLASIHLVICPGSIHPFDE